MEKVGIFYGPAGGRTENVAKRLGELLGEENHDLVSLDRANIADLHKYKNIIFGIATIGKETWDAEPLESGWFDFLPELEKIELEGKKIAIYGLGDHVRWPRQFVDAMGQLYEVLKQKGLDTVGKVSPDDYTFDESEALVDGIFVGLPIDEDFQPELTDQRITDWVDKLCSEFE
ncbi:MAG: flavodoxin [Bacteroidales bacterium]|jgi:flavodoxin I|nr:flavodoxin [Bacteroidales bacterium]